MKSTSQLWKEILIEPYIYSPYIDGLINLEVQGGTAPYSTSLNSSQDENFVEGQMSYGNLASGDYVVFIRDANGCMTTEIVTINSGVNLEGSVEVVYECDGDSPTNYLDLNFEDPSMVSDLLYGLDSNDPNDMVLTSDFTNLAPGEHTRHGPQERHGTGGR